MGAQLMEQKQNTFLQINNDLLSAQQITYNNKTFELTLLEKCLYSYMRYRYTFFASMNQEYFESQQFIADNFASSVKTIQRAMKKLEEFDILKIDCSRKNNRYLVNDLMFGSFSNDHVVAENMKRPTSFDKGNTKQKRKPTKETIDKTKSDQDLPLVVAPSPVVCYDFEDDNDPPF